jgi:RimJ/RimL family protein N-acetyltransferase
MPYGLVIGEDSIVAQWAFSAFHLYPTPFNRALGIVNKDKIVIGAILLQNFNGANVELSYYGPRTLSVGIARAIARLVMGEFSASRVTVVTSKRNRRLMQSLSRFGFKLEGIQRCYYGHEDNKKNTGVRFVMFREQIAKIAAGHPPGAPLVLQG